MSNSDLYYDMLRVQMLDYINCVCYSSIYDDLYIVDDTSTQQGWIQDGRQRELTSAARKYLLISIHEYVFK